VRKRGSFTSHTSISLALSLHLSRMQSVKAGGGEKQAGVRGASGSLEADWDGWMRGYRKK